MTRSTRLEESQPRNTPARDCIKSWDTGAIPVSTRRDARDQPYVVGGDGV
jgi:hypothetical protein